MSENEFLNYIESLFESGQNRDEIFSEILKQTCSYLIMGMGIISQIEDENYHVIAVYPDNTEIQKDSVFALEDTYCYMVSKRQESIAIDDLGEEPLLKSHPVYLNMHLSSYICSPIFKDGVFLAHSTSQQIMFETPICRSKNRSIC